MDFDLYMREASSYPLLTQEEEAKLARQYTESRDPAAARRIIESHLRLVVSIAREYGSHEDLPDLVQEGNIGLLRSLEKFDHSRSRFCTYATYHIRAAILKYMLDNSVPLALSAPREARRLFCALSQAQKERSDLTADQIVNALEASPEIDALLPLLSAKAAAQEDVSTDSDASPDETIDACRIHEKLHALVELFAHRLTERELAIFRARWLTENPSPLTELGRQHGLHYSRISQIESKVLGMLRKFVRGKIQPGDALEAC